jgi:hypothetical protein
MKSFKEYLAEEEYSYSNPVVGDVFAFEIREEQLIESVVSELLEDGIIIEVDDAAVQILESYGLLEQGQPGAHARDSISPIHSNVNKEYSHEDDLAEGMGNDSPVANAIIRRIMFQHPGVLDTHGPERVMQAAQEVADWVGDVDEIGSSDVSGWTRDAIRALAELPDEPIDEAEYQGRDVPLGKPMRGDVAKSKVYVRDPKTGNVKKVNFGDPNMKIKKSNPARRKSFRARHNCDNPGPRTKARYWSCRAW